MGVISRLTRGKTDIINYFFLMVNFGINLRVCLFFLFCSKEVAIRLG